MISVIINVLVYVVWITFLFPFACLGMLVTLNTDTALWMARHWWAPVLVWRSGAKLEIEGREHVDPARPTIYVSNHQSTIDIPILFLAIPVNFRYIAKSQLRWIPVLGWYLWIGGHVFIDRANRARAISSLDAAARRIRAGTSIVVYPEGTRSPEGRILPFKKGAFALAMKARVAVVPVTIEGSGKVMPKNSWRVTPGVVHVKIGKPIDPSRFDETDRDGLLIATRNVIIDQSLALGGLGGDRDEPVALPGREGVGRSRKAAAGAPSSCPPNVT